MSNTLNSKVFRNKLGPFPIFASMKNLLVFLLALTP
jgi:hypothetical protein